MGAVGKGMGQREEKWIADLKRNLKMYTKGQELQSSPERQGARGQWWGCSQDVGLNSPASVLTQLPAGSALGTGHQRPAG